MESSDDTPHSNISDFINNLDDKQKVAVEGFLNLVGGNTELENAMLEGDKMISDDCGGTKNNLSKVQIDGIISYLGEFMRSFLLISYDMNGNRVLIGNTKTQQDIDSLLTFSQKVPQFLSETEDLVDGGDDYF